MKKQKLTAMSVTLLLLCSILSGCGGKTADSYQKQASYDYSVNGGFTAGRSTAAMAPAAEEMYYDEEDVLEFENDAAYGSYTTSSAPDITADEIEETQDSEAQEGSEKINAEKLVYTGNLTVETTDFSSTISRIKQTITEMGGFIESENVSDDAYGWYLEDYRKSSSSLRSYIQARIPSAKFYEFLDGIEGEGAKVTNRSVNVENISRRYSETATSIESYKIQERRLLDMMEDATRVSDMLEIENRLSEVQGWLKQYQNTLAGMDTDVAYSTVSLNVREVGIYSQPEATSFAEKIGEAFSDGIDSFVEGAQDFSIWFVGNILNILVFIVVCFILIKIIKKIFRRIGNKRKAGKEKKASAEDKSSET